MWFQTVGNFLEKLDNQAKDVVEEGLLTVGNIGGGTTRDLSNDVDDDDDGAIDTILAARGLLTTTTALSHDDDDELEENNNKKQQPKEPEEEEEKKHLRLEQQEQQFTTSSSANVDVVEHHLSSSMKEDQAVEEEGIQEQIIQQQANELLSKQQQQAFTNVHEKNEKRVIDDNNDNNINTPNEGWDDDDLDDIPVSNSNDDAAVIEEMQKNKNQVIITSSIPAVDEASGVEAGYHDTMNQEEEAEVPNNDVATLESSVKVPTEISGSMEEESLVDAIITPAKQHDHDNYDDGILLQTATTTPFSTPAQFAASTKRTISNNRNEYNNSEEEMIPISVMIAKLKQQEIMLMESFRNENNTIGEEMVPLSVMNDKLKQQESTLTEMFQKEMKKLKRHVVSLNTQLEATETEMIEQRKELENAAQRMEKDRMKQKEMIDTLTTKHTTEINNMKAQQEQTMKEIHAKHDEQMHAIQEKLQLIERRRQQEGGDYSKELSDAIEREQNLIQQYELLNDEKETLSQHIETLQKQQEMLGIRLESLTHNADLAMERERDAERRLDEALDVHAKQISIRQTREAELEQTIAELGAALVMLRGENSSSSIKNNNNIKNEVSSSDQTAGDVTSQTLENENETLRLQLSLEQERCKALEHELHEISKERADEAIALTRKQQQHDRTINSLNQRISQLELEIRDKTNTSSNGTQQLENNNQRSSSQENEDIKRIKSLSEEVVRQREKISSYSSEILTLRTRLNVALNRATVAEAVAEQEQGRMSIDNGLDLESSGLLVSRSSTPTSANSNNFKNRRGRREKDSDTIITNIPTMRKALMLDTSSSNSVQSTSARIGQTLDVIDTILVKIGRQLRYNPFVRLFFVVYLVVLHLWTFAILFFHAHNLDNYHQRSNSAYGIAHGPAAVMIQQQQPLMALGENLVGAEVGEVPNSNAGN